MKESLTKTEYNLTCIILFTIDFVITGYVSMYLWNNIIATVFSVRTLSFWQCQAVAFCLLYFIPHLREKIDDCADMLLTDIIYTLLVWVFSASIVAIVGF